MPRISMLLAVAALLQHLSHSAAVNHRRLLHQPLYPTIAEPPSPQPQPVYPKYPFSSSPPVDDDTTTQNSPFFFPFFPSPPPPLPPTPPSTSDSAAVTFPANISSLVTLPTEPNKNGGAASHAVKLISLAASLALLLMLAFALLAFVLIRRRKHHPYHRQRLNLHGADDLDDVRNAGGSSTARKPATGNSVPNSDATVSKLETPAKSAAYVAIGSPELHPLPPLTALPPRNYPNAPTAATAATANNDRSSSTSSAAASLMNDNHEEQQKQYPEEEDKSVKSPECPFLTTTISHPPPPPRTRAFSPFHTDDASPAAKPKLKPFPWEDKVVKVGSEEHFKKSNSLQFDEEMIGVEALFNPETKRGNRILDPNKSRDIGILLRALNVTVDEVCIALTEGNADALGSELLESLLKMAPTEEEEQKLEELKDNDGVSERFLRAVLEIPFTFKRIDAMLYVANFEYEVGHLKGSFDTLESACKELKSSRMFRKLLESILKARTNIGSDRGDLEPLLELAGAKASDGKTTLLHSVVQELIQVEGLRLLTTSSEPHNRLHRLSFRDEIELRKLGLQAVSRLGGELTDVKKAATVDGVVLVDDVIKLCSGLGKVREAVDLVKDGGFSDNMSEFLRRAEAEVAGIQAREGIALSMVKGLTEYFHGDSGREEGARRLRVFKVVRDFLSALDRVCKDVGKMNERAAMSSACRSQIPAYPSFDGVFRGFDEKRECSSSDNDSSSSSY